MITPIISLLSPQPSSAIAGSKGAGLHNIKRNLENYHPYGMDRVTVPKHYIVPVASSKSKGIVITNELSDGELYAVRSSGPVSMPGMMSTVLNVPKTGIQQAVCAVWDSYDSEHCLAYRVDNHIPDTGTAVVIQEMVPDIEISGVVFTTSPTSFFNKGTFTPDIEYVEGSGEELVGGTKAPLVMLEDHLRYGAIVSVAKRLYDHFGDSDIEFSFSKTTGLNILQCRPIVFASVCLAEVDAAADEFICKGGSIAANGTVTGVLRMPDDTLAFEPDTIIFMETFTPENYRFLHSAVGIITRIGGKHCHAAIVGRALGKVVISGIQYADVVNLRGRRILLRGPQGIVCTVKEGVSTAHHGADGASVLADVDDSFRLPAIHTFKRYCRNDTTPHFGRVEGVELVAHFYNRYNDYLELKITDESMLDEINRTSKLLATYLYAICCGEARHGTALKSARDDDSSILEFLTNKAKLGVDGYGFMGSTAGDKSRTDFIDTVIFQPADLEQAIDVMSTVDYVFRYGSWGGSYGGKRWASISDVWLKFARKELTAMLFLDAAFNLVHNGGSVLGKVSWLTRGHNLSEVLTMRRIGDIERMVAYAYSGYSPESLSHALAGPIIGDAMYSELLLNEPEHDLVKGVTCTTSA